VINTYNLNKINDWDEKAAIHILSRTLFGYKQQDIDFALSLSLDEFVDNHLLADRPEPTPPFWVYDSSSDNAAERTRELTYWWYDQMLRQGYQSRFDDGEKTILGETGNFGYVDVVDIIFRQQVTAIYLCRQLYKEFIYIVPDENFVNELADLLRQNDYQLKPVLSALLKSTYFHSEEIRGSKIKNPVEFIVQVMRQFNINAPDFNYMRQTAEQLEQKLFDPPNVSGWDGDKRWISTNTLPARNIFSDSVIEGEKPNGSELTFTINLVDYARTFPDPENAVALVNDVTKIFIQFPLSEKRIEYLLETLLDGAEVYDWSTFDPQAENRLKLFFKALMRLSEYQLS
jgi:hypothetical protein